MPGRNARWCCSGVGSESLGLFPVKSLKHRHLAFRGVPAGEEAERQLHTR